MDCREPSQLTVYLLTILRFPQPTIFASAWQAMETERGGKL